MTMNKRKLRYISRIKEERRISCYTEISWNLSSPFNCSNVAIPQARLGVFLVPDRCFFSTSAPPLFKLQAAPDTAVISHLISLLWTAKCISHLKSYAPVRLASWIWEFIRRQSSYIFFVGLSSSFQTVNSQQDIKYSGVIKGIVYFF